MELRRLDPAKKPTFVVPNHLVDQWGAEFLKLYPQARIFSWEGPLRNREKATCNGRNALESAIHMDLDSPCRTCTPSGLFPSTRHSENGVPWAARTFRDRDKLVDDLLRAEDDS
jgi:hypothetical protein